MLLLVFYVDDLLTHACERWLPPQNHLNQTLRYLSNVVYALLLFSELKRRMKAQKKADEKAAKDAQQKDEPKNSTPKVKPVDESQIDPNVIMTSFTKNYSM